MAANREPGIGLKLYFISWCNSIKFAFNDPHYEFTSSYMSISDNEAYSGFAIANNNMVIDFWWVLLWRMQNWQVSTELHFYCVNEAGSMLVAFVSIMAYFTTFTDFLYFQPYLCFCLGRDVSRSTGINWTVRIYLLFHCIHFSICECLFKVIWCHRYALKLVKFKQKTNKDKIDIKSAFLSILRGTVLSLGQQKFLNETPKLLNLSILSYHQCLINVKAGQEWKKYFISWWSLTTNGILGGLFVSFSNINNYVG